MRRFSFLSVVVIATLLFFGCNGDTENSGGSNNNNGTNDENETEQGHSHADSDVLTWPVKEKQGESGYEIWLGHHGVHFHGGDSIEPAIAITLNGESIADAKVFNSMQDPSDVTKSIVDEVATIYEPETPEEPAHYAQGEMTIPKDAKKCVIRYRIVIGDQPEISRDVTIELEE